MLSAISWPRRPSRWQERLRRSVSPALDADNSDAQHAFGFRINDQLGHALGAVESQARPEAAQGNLATLISRFSFCAWVSVRPAQAISGSVKTTAGMALGSKCDFVSGDGFDGGAAFMRGFVRQHGFADHIADGVDGGVVGLQLLVDLDESARADFDLSFVEAGDFGIGFASDGDQNFVEDFFALFDFGPVEGDAHAIGFFFHRGDGGVEQDGGENLFHAFVQGKDQVAVGSGQEAGQHFDHRNFRSQRGIDGAEFEADVSAADYEQGAGDVGQIEGGGGIHHARGVELESGDDGRARAGGDNDAVEAAGFFAAVGFGDRRVVEFSNAARPWMYSTLRCFESRPRPPVSFLTTSFFPRSQAGEIDVRGGEFDAPILWRGGIRRSACATCSRAFEGMHPR